MTLEERVSRLEQQQGLAAATLELSRDISNLAAGIGGDIRAIRGDIAGIRQDVAGLHSDVAEIRRLLERRRNWWFW